MAASDQLRPQFRKLGRWAVGGKDQLPPFAQVREGVQDTGNRPFQPGQNLDSFHASATPRAPAVTAWRVSRTITQKTCPTDRVIDLVDVVVDVQIAVLSYSNCLTE